MSISSISRSISSREGQVQAITNRTNAVIQSMWSVGEKKLREDYWTRLRLYNSVVRTMITYGAIIWGWERQAEIDKLQVKFIKWMIGLDRCTATCIILEETKTQRYKHWVETGERAIKFEEEFKEKDKKIL